MMFSTDKSDTDNAQGTTCPSPVMSTIVSSSLNDLDDSLKKLTIDKKINIRPLSSKRNPFKSRKKTTFKEFTSKYDKFTSKGLEEITDKMVELWCSDGYREYCSKDNKKKASCQMKDKFSLPTSPSTSSSTSSSKGSDLNPNEGLTCARQANCDYSDSPSVNELAAYLEEGLFFPKKMSFMAEMMYT